nr:cadherin domain-containing protein [bacterium]
GNAATLTLAAPGQPGSIANAEAIVVDTTAPVFTSTGVASAIAENSNAGGNTVVYDATADADSGVNYSLKTSGDGSLFSINATTGSVTLTGDPNFEAKDGYVFTVVATDGAGNSTEQDVTLAITNVDDSAPVFGAGTDDTGVTLPENAATGTVVYTAYASDDADMSAGVTYTLGGTDASKFAIDAQTGEVTLNASLDRETKETYEFTVTATDGASQTDEITVSGTVSDIDEVAPTVSSVTSTTADDQYNAGDVIDIVVTFDEAVVVTGTPQLTLETGSTDRAVDYASGSGSTELVFKYTVQAGDTSGDLDYVTTTSLGLNGGTIKDVAGNAATLTLAAPGASGSIANAEAIVVDTTAPDAPVITSISTPNSDTTPTISGTAEADSTVTIYANGELLGLATATGGNYTFTVDNADALLDGNYRITATATDAVGNVSADATVQDIVIDSTVPTAPVITAISDDTGTVGDKITSDTVLTISGTAEAGASVQVKLENVDVGDPVTADANGSWSYSHTPTLAQGNHSFTAVATDGASNASSTTSPAYVVKVDTDADTDSNFAVSFATADDTTNASEVSHVSMTLSGVDSDAASVSVSIDDAAVGSPIVRSASKVGSDWVVPDVDISTLSDGTVTVTATVTDDAGNTATATDTLTLDTTAPTATIAVIAGDNEINVAENTAGFNITGTTTAEDGSTVTISFESGATLDGGNIATVASNAWSIAVAAKEAGDKFKEGDELVTITVTDTAGNTSSEVSRLSEVVSTQSTSGNQADADFSGVTVLTLTAATTLPSATDRLPTKIVADGKEITMAGAAIDLTGVTLDRVGDLVLTNATSQITMSPNQATAFNAGTVTLAGGAILVTTSGDLSSQDLANVTLTLNGATTLVDHNDDLPLSIDADSNTITVGDDLDVTGVTLTQLGTVSVNASKTLTISASQADGESLTGTGTVAVTALESTLGANLSGLAAGLTTTAALNS